MAQGRELVRPPQRRLRPVDLEAARKAKVPILQQPRRQRHRVSEHTLLLLLAVLERVVRPFPPVFARHRPRKARA